MKIVEKSDGSGFIITTMRGRVDLSKQVIDIMKKKWKNFFEKKVIRGFKGYPQTGPTQLHTVVMRSFPEKRKEAETKWAEHIKNGYKLFIMHIDDNPLNFNIENLMWGPSNLNQMQIKMFPQQNSKGNWYAKPVVNGKAETIKTFPTEDEVKHQLDINKIRRAHEDFRDYLFEHAMHRPEAFEEYYTDIPTLLSREILPKKQPRKKTGTTSTYRTFSSLNEFYSSDIGDNWKSIIRDIFSKINIIPFDNSLDYVVYTKGGRGKERILLMEKNCYTRLILPHKYALGDCEGKYLCLTHPVSAKLHVAILDRIKAKDNLKIRHGPGEHLDNRKRTFLTGTHSENMGDRGIETQASQYLGVTKDKRSGKWKVDITLEDGYKIFLGSFGTEEEAYIMSSYAQNNRDILKEATTGMEPTQARKYVRDFCDKFLTDFDSEDDI